MDADELVVGREVRVDLVQGLAFLQMIQGLRDTTLDAMWNACDGPPKLPALLIGNYRYTINERDGEVVKKQIRTDAINDSATIKWRQS